MVRWSGLLEGLSAAILSSGALASSPTDDAATVTLDSNAAIGV